MTLVIANWPVRQIQGPAKVTRVVVNKSARTLSLVSDKTVVATFDISLGPNPVGDKRQEGDGRTPEGMYVLDYRNPQSRFHHSIHISYPNTEDRVRAAESGVDPGGDIMIHGLPNGLGWLGRLHRLIDWTNGCVAVTDQEMDLIWHNVKNGTPIEIKP
jgi:murein L,D-transpeptidase YafK